MVADQYMVAEVAAMAAVPPPLSVLVEWAFTVVVGVVVEMMVPEPLQPEDYLTMVAVVVAVLLMVAQAALEALQLLAEQVVMAAAMAAHLLRGQLLQAVEAGQRTKTQAQVVTDKLS